MSPRIPPNIAYYITPSLRSATWPRAGRLGSRRPFPAVLLEQLAHAVEEQAGLDGAAETLLGHGQEGHLGRAGLAIVLLRVDLVRQHPDDPTQCVSAPTIYAWIEQHEDRLHWQSFLRRRGRRPCRPTPRKPALTPGSTIDTVLGPPGSGGLVTLVDRQSRFTVMSKIQSKNADHVHAKIKQRLQALAAEQRHSVTFDNGSEFARCDRLESHLGIELYFADPGCPFQRGTNENTNGLIRQYFPKGTDFQTISRYEVRRVENLLNHRSRACLDFQTPAEVFHAKSPPSSCD